MDKHIEQLLNPNGQPLTEEQQEVIETFNQVEQEMKRMDNLAQRLSVLPQHLAKQQH